MSNRKLRRLGAGAAVALVVAAAPSCTAVMLSEPVRYAEPDEASFVPPAYMPPPGQCRIWYPNQSASRQPPPGDCAELRQRTPPGATLVYGS